MPTFPFKTSFWFDQSPIATQPPLERHITADVVIIGGGFAGLSAAYHLRLQNTDLRIILLEANHIGYGASGRAAGWLMNLPPALWMLNDLDNVKIRENIQFAVHLCESNIQQIGQLVQERDIDCQWTETQHVLVARNRLEEATLKWIAPRFSLAGLETQIYDGSQARRVAGYESKAALGFKIRSIQPYRLATGLKEWLVEQGVVIYENTRVDRIENLADGIMVFVDNGMSVQSGWGIIATNAYTNNLMVPAKKPGGAIKHTYMIATEPLDTAVLTRISATQTPFGDPSISFFIGRIFKDRLLFNGVDRGSHNTLADDQHVPSYQRVYAEMIGRFPFLENVQVAAVWGGAVQETQTEAPYIRHTPNNPRLIWNVGYGGGSGIGLALLSGRITTALMSESTSPDKDALRLHTLYAHSRFPLMGSVRAVTGVAKQMLAW